LKAESKLTVRLGLTQIISWGSGFYIPAILAVPISQSIGISTETFFWAFTLSLLTSGLLGPRVGRWIDTHGGRKVLPVGNFFFIAGLTVLALSQEPIALFVAWFLIGIGGSMGNYDAVFATAVGFFGDKSNQVIAGITVLAGLSSTIAWPITTLLSEQFDWRVAIWFWAFAHLLIALPLHLTIPKEKVKEITLLTGPIKKILKGGFRLDLVVVIFAVMFALEGFIVSAVNTTLPLLLTQLGASSQLALMAAVILGPSQVLARVLMVALGKRSSPILVAAISIAAHPLGVLLVLFFGVNALIPFVILHGIGVGLNPIIRGTLPLLFFGAQSYGQRQGYIMMLSKIVSAFSPVLLTLMVLSNPTTAIVATFLMGTVAALLLVWLSSIHRIRQRAEPDVSAASSLEG